MGLLQGLTILEVLSPQLPCKQPKKHNAHDLHIDLHHTQPDSCPDLRSQRHMGLVRGLSIPEVLSPQLPHATHPQKQ